MFYEFTHKETKESKVIEAIDLSTAASMLPPTWTPVTYNLNITHRDPRRKPIVIPEGKEWIIGRYIGPDSKLKNEEALVRRHETRTDHVMVQFNGHKGEPRHDLSHPITGAKVCFGWHMFDAFDFVAVEKS